MRTPPRVTSRSPSASARNRSAGPPQRTWHSPCLAPRMRHLTCCLYFLVALAFGVSRLPATAQIPVTPAICGDAARGLDGQPLVDGGALAIGQFPFGATLGSDGAMAFYSQVSGTPRNQGVFVANANGVRSIARGSGLGLGSGSPGAAVGDPTPIGGRFAGFPLGGASAPVGQNQGLVFSDLLAPAINRNGDVLFLADVQGGSSPRGLFLYRSATQTISSVASIGDPLPGGGTLSALGSGSLNASGSVVFLAHGGSASDERILRWDNGVLSSVAKIGDPAPSFGAYNYFGIATSLLPDGTWLPIQPAPDINDRGSVCFIAYTSQLSMHGVVFDDGSGHQWHALVGQTVTPQGNAVGECSAATLNEADEVAFYCSFWNGMFLNPGGWLVGRAGQFREALLFGDSVGPDTVIGLAQGANPASCLSDSGDLVVWSGLQTASGVQRALVLCRANGSRDVIRRQGNASSSGGALGVLSFWPSINERGQVALSSQIVGSPTGARSGHALVTLCPDVITYCTAGTSVIGCSAAISAVGTASASAASNFSVVVQSLEGQRSGLIFYGLEGRVAWPWSTGSSSWLCVKSPIQRTALLNSGGTPLTCNGVLTLDLNAFRAANPGALGEPLSVGQQLNAQGWHRDPGAAKSTGLSDALEFWMAP